MSFDAPTPPEQPEQQPPAGGYGAPPPPPPPPAPAYGTQTPGYPAPQQPAGYAVAPNSSKATLSLIFGILGLVVCMPFGIAAVIVGNQAKAEIAASGGYMSGEGSAKAGVILGWIAIGLTIAAVVVILLVVILGAAVSSNSG